MIMNRVLAVIPASGGSKGIPRKNIRLLAGKPLIAYSIETAKMAKSVTDVIVSTEDTEIAEVARQYGAEVVLRPPELADDHSLVMDAVRHLLQVKKEQGFEYDIIVLLEPTAPLRKVEYIEKAVGFIKEKNYDSVATFSESSAPVTRLWKIHNHIAEPLIDKSDPFKPRQKQETGYVLNGLVYAVKREAMDKYTDSKSWLLGNNYAYVVQPEWAIDIDKESDLKLAELIMERYK